jgi:hypothetical protein|tara:strand:- start:2728 stop:3258 length:531 start_codon:yes stop_codon:yes gene_type:complete
MPKPKPDNIVRHEIVLGTAERQIVRDAQTAYSINRIASPITNMSASGFVVAGGAAIVVIDYILDHLGLDPDWREIVEDMTGEQLSEWLDGQNLRIGGLIALVNPLFGLPFIAAGVNSAIPGIADVFPAWAQPGGGNLNEQQSEEIAEAARQREERETKSFASWGIGFRKFIRGGGL